ncbi:LIM/homeobox protein Lhx9-like [Agrilus planipennis]|uniref:LIM/homeobox protein Lhx9-like n=1 Tax=Agrilus planipennis TaxID=224129 RepID=A0A1W4WTN2_AGRPL|nr:LIM/homeobox protein Lhx9-like [Agrilus planipennis]
MLKERDSLDGHHNNGASSPCSSLRGPSGAVICAACRDRIHDRYYLLAVDRQWHAHCLKCSECKLPLDSEVTCFAREGNIYCKEDYYRLYGVTRCARCHAGITSNALVMRARDLVYHINCFYCTSCGIPLSKGDHFGMKAGLIYCRPHYELLEYCEPRDLFRRSESPGSGYFSPVATQNQKGRPRKRKFGPELDPTCGELSVVPMRMTAAALEIMHQSEMPSSIDPLSYDSSVSSPASSTGHQTQRTKRMRTSFKHHQLRTMKSYFAINQNPDAKDLKQLAQKTGLSKRVLQVWFQNARAKWRRNMMRQEGGHGGSTATPQNGTSTPSVSSVLSDANSLSNQSGMDELHHHLHSQNGQTLTFSDIY